MTQKLHIAKIHLPVTSLGTGRRLALWIMGCLKRCKGCITPEFQRHEGGSFYPERSFYGLVRFAIESEKLTGITISGGEPLLQWRPLRNSILALKKEFPFIDVLVYTGFTYKPDCDLNFLEADEKIEVDWIDILVDGEFQIDNPAKDFIRGSENQKIYSMSKLGEAKLKEMKQLNSKRPKIELFQREDLFFSGIAKPNFTNDLNNILLQKNIELKK